MPDFFPQTNPCQRPREALDDPFKMRSLGTILFDFLNYYGSQYPHEDNVYMSISEGKVLESDSAETKKLGLDIRCPISGGMYLHPCWILAEDIDSFIRKYREIFRTTFSQRHDTLVQALLCGYPSE